MKVSLVVIVAGILLLGQSVEAIGQPKSLSYTVFLEDLREGRVSEVTFIARGMLVTLEGVDWTEQFVVSERAPAFRHDPLLQAELARSGIEPRVSIDQPAASILALAMVAPFVMWGIIPLANLVIVVLIYRRLRKAKECRNRDA